MFIYTVAQIYDGNGKHMEKIEPDDTALNCGFPKCRCYHRHKPFHKGGV